MKKEYKYLQWFLAMLVLAVTASFFSACSKMDATYEDFIKDGQIIYPGKADSIEVHSGRGRLHLSWLASNDPKVTNAKIYWNNQTDSLEVPIEGRASGQDTVVVSFDDLSEGSYVFEIYTFDSAGNRSVQTEVIGEVYGEAYESKLLSRPVDEVDFDEGVLKLNWGAVPDTTAIGSEIVYVDENENEQVLFVPESSVITEIDQYAVPGTFKHRTLYMPHITALDTFYSNYASHHIEGPPPPPSFLDKTNWTITASSEDIAGGRGAANLIDGDPQTMFVNELNAGLTYPHSVTVDMGETIVGIEGFYFYQRNFNQTKTVEVLTSEDGESWNSHGEFTLSDVSGEPIFLELADTESFRYFRHIFLDDYGGSSNVNIMEMGVYTRPVPPVHLEKTNWTITATSEDVAGGRVASNLIDGDLDNLWVNELGAGLDYPHEVKIDMGEKLDDIEGFYFYQRGMNNTRNVEVLISQDGETWETTGEFTIPNIAERPAYIELPEPLSFRFFKHVYLDAYTDSANINLREMGAYVTN